MLLRRYVETEPASLLRRVPFGYENRIDLIQPQVYLKYLPVVMTIDGIEWSGFVETSALLAVSYGAGVALPPELVETPAVLQLAREHFLAVSLRVQTHDGAWLEAARVEPTGPPELLDPGQWFYRLSTDAGELLCTELGFLPTVSTECTRVGWASTPIVLTISLGVSTLPLSALRCLAVGDLVVIGNSAAYVWCGKRSLFKALFKGDYIMLDALEFDDRSASRRPTGAAAGDEMDDLDPDPDDPDYSNDFEELDDLDGVTEIGLPKADGNSRESAQVSHRGFSTDAPSGSVPRDRQLRQSRPGDRLAALAAAHTGDGAVEARFVPDDLPIELTFVVAEKELSLTELYQLRPGQIIELENAERVEVRIKAGRMVVAKGELVRYGERLAVEIDKVYRA